MRITLTGDREVPDEVAAALRREDYQVSITLNIPLANGDAYTLNVPITVRPYGSA